MDDTDASDDPATFYDHWPNVIYTHAEIGHI